MKKLLLCLLIAGITTSLSEALVISMTGARGGAVTGATFTEGVVGTAATVNNWPAAGKPRAIRSTFLSFRPSRLPHLNFAELNTGVILTPTGANAAQIIRRITFTTANDAPERDPLTFTLYGGTAAQLAGNPTIASLTTIATGNTGFAAAPDPATARLTAAATQTFANAAAFGGYLLVFPTVRDAAAANSMQISDIRFETIPEPTTALLGALGALGLVTRRRRA